jgi:hypothetical protein
MDPACYGRCRSCGGGGVEVLKRGTVPWFQQEIPMPQYMLVILGDENQAATMTPAEQEKNMGAWFAYTQALVEAKKMLGGEALMPSKGGKRVSIKNGKKTIVDGPFTETREVVGGYYLIDAKDVADAVEWAARCPGAAGGTMEVREVMKFDVPGAPKK